MTITELLLAAIDEAYDKRSWHGTNLRGSLRGVTSEQAAWRVSEGRHNIWELTIHAAYWKYDIRLHREHKALREAVEKFPAKRWTRKAPGKPFLFEGLVRGVAAHDLYHAGQIQLLKKLRD